MDISENRTGIINNTISDIGGGIEREITANCGKEDGEAQSGQGQLSCAPARTESPRKEKHFSTGPGRYRYRR